MAEKSRLNKQYLFIAMAFVLCLAIVLVTILYVARPITECKVTIYVSPNSYTEKFIEKDGKLTRPADPTPENGYRFDNWFEDESCNTVYDFDRPISRDTTIYAGFVREVYAVIFWSNFVGTEPESQEFSRDFRAYESSFPASTTVPVDSSGRYEFVCWADNPVVGPNTNTYVAGAPVQMPIDGISLYAIWRGVHQAVTFAFSSEAYSYGQPLQPRVDTSGRFGETYTIPDDFGVIDHKNFEKYFVGFYRQDIITGVVDTSTIYRLGSTINLLGDVQFVEAWENSTSSVIFNMGEYTEGVPPASKHYIKGHRFNLPTAERPHYILSGWSDGKGSMWEPDTAFFMPESKTTLFAVWTEATYFASFDPNALVQGVMEPTPVLYDSIMNMPDSGFIYPGEKCVFKYWVTEENKDFTYEQIEQDGLVRYVAGSYISGIDDDITFYAIWEAKSMAVEYKLTNTGASAASEEYIQSLFVNDYTKKYEEYYYIPEYDADLIVHEDSDKIFGGFKILNDPIGTVYSANDQLLVLGEITLVFNWVGTGNDIVFELGGGYMTNVRVPSYIAGHAFNMPLVVSPERTNFEFMGWVKKDYLDEEWGGVAPDWNLIDNEWQDETVKWTNISGVNFVMPEGGITFVAVWRAAAYSIVFNKGLNPYIEGSMPTIFTIFGASYLVTNEYDAVNSYVGGDLKVGFKYYGYEFMGWATRANQANPEYAVGSILTMDASIGNRNITLYPCFKSADIIIKYNGSGGTYAGLPVVENNTYQFGQFITLHQAFEKDNFEFVGWSVVQDASLTGYDNGDVQTVSPSGSTILVDSLFIGKLDALNISHFENGNITINLYAIFIGARTTVVFNGNGGLGTMEAQSVRYGDKDVVLTANTFAKSGYEFMGWSLSAEGSVEYDDEDIIDVDGPTILYAKWRGEAVSLVIYMNDPDYTYGSETITLTQVDGKVLRFGDTYNFVPITNLVVINPNKEFVKYNTLATGTGASYDPLSPDMQDRRVVLNSVNNFYAIWKGKSKNITYDLGDVILDNGNTVSNKIESAEYNQLFRLTHINIDYQTFRHYSALSGDPTNHYIVGGDVVAGLWISSMGGTTYEFRVGETVIYPLGSNILITDNTVMRIYWVTDLAQAATVMFDLNSPLDASLNPSSINPITGVINGLVTLPNAPERNNYAFDGWNSKEDGSGTNYDAADAYPLITSTTTLYAQWTAKEKKIRYNANGGSFAGLPLDGLDYLSEGIHVESATSLASFSVGQLSKSHYEIEGFSLSAQGNLGGQHVYAMGSVFYMAESLFSNSGAEVAEVVLYVIWKGQSVSINFMGQGGTVSSGSPTYSEVARVGEEATLYNDFSKTGYVFKYFTQTSADSGTKYCVSGNPSSFKIDITTSGSVTLYAQWQPQNRTITLKKDASGTVSYEMEIAYGSTWIMFDPSSTSDSVTLPNDALWTSPDNGTFLGWKMGDIEYPWNAANPGEIIVREYIEFVAMWSVIPAVTIIFDRGTGLINGDSIISQVLVESPIGGSFTVPGSFIEYQGGTAQFSKAGYVFDGWSYGVLEFYAGENVMLNSTYFSVADLSAYQIVLVARYVAETYTISYVAENGIFEGLYPAVVVVDPSISASYEVYGVNAVSHRSGNYTLLGWDLMVAGVFDGVVDYSPLQSIATPAANIALRAIWSPQVKTIVINSGEATFRPIPPVDFEQPEVYSYWSDIIMDWVVLSDMYGFGPLQGGLSPTFDIGKNIHLVEVSNSTLISIGVLYGNKIRVYGKDQYSNDYWIVLAYDSNNKVADLYLAYVDEPVYASVAKTAKYFSGDGGVTQHKIGGISSGGDAVVIVAYIEYTIIWLGEQRNIVLEGNGGYLGSHTTAHTSVHYVGETINLANIFTKDNCTFDKWLYSNGAELGNETYIAVGGAFTIEAGSYLHNDTDIVFIAQWNPASVYVNYHGNGGNVIVQIAGEDTPFDPSDDEYSYQSLVQRVAPLGLGVNYTVIANPFIYSGFQFLYWSTSNAPDSTNVGTKYYPGSGINETIADVTGPVTLYAIWGLPQWTLTFSDNIGGSDIQVQARGSIVVPAPGSQFNGSLIDINKSYSTFLNWNTLADGTGTVYRTGDSMEVNDNITLYAFWADIPVYVYFDANGGTGTVSYDPIAQIIGTNYTTPQWFAEFTPPLGATFVGWSFDELATVGEAVAAGGSIIIDGNFANLVSGNPDHYEIVLFAIYSY